MKKLSLFIVAVFSVLLFAGCGKTAPQQIEEIGTNDMQPVICTDLGCFMPLLAACSPAQMSMKLSTGVNYVITVVGLEWDKCHHTMKVVDDAWIMIAWMPASDCSLPQTEMNDNYFLHFFGQDKEVGKENILANNTKLEQQYCTQLLQ